MNEVGAGRSADRDEEAGTGGRFTLPEPSDIPVVGPLSWPDRLRLVAGAALLVVALVAVFTTAIPRGVVEAVGAADVEGALATMAVFAVVQGAVIALLARRRSGEVAVVPDPTVVSSPPPTAGEEFAAAFEEVDATAANDGSSAPDADADLRGELRETAVQVLERRPGWSREDGREAVADGRWTDDPFAAAYLGTSGSVYVPPLARLREWAAPGSREAYRARRAANELWRLAADEGGSR